ncbi:MAG: peptidylprolyl isomerase [Fuerstiella sp.]
MFVGSWFLKRMRAGRSRRRKAIGRRVAPVAAELERRVLLTATLTTALPDTSFAVSGQASSVTLTDYFDDPDLTGSAVEVQTPLGTFYLEMYDVITPITVQNFLTLTESGNYADMFFHRSAAGFVIQGGGFNYPVGATAPGSIANNGTIVNEFDNWFDPQLGGLQAGSPVNLRGTVAMAKLGGDPDSATSQWFVSLVDNSTTLDPQNGGFTVFAHVLFDGMTVVDEIAALPLVNAGGAFATLPVNNFTSGTVQRQHLVTSSTNVVDELSFSVTENSNASLVTAVITDGVLQLSPAAGQSGIASIIVQATDLQGNSVSSTIQVSVGVPSATELTGPVGDDILKRPTITWNSVGGADSYELWVNQIGGTNAIIRETSLTSASFTATTDLADGTYRGWVRVKNSEGYSNWSASFDFLIGVAVPNPVSITSPSVATVGGRRPLIAWTTADQATEYDIWVNHIGVQNQVIREPDWALTSYTPTSDLADGTYRVWVKAKNTTGDSAWSSSVTFQVGVAPPSITGPTGSSIPAQPTITWTSGGAGATYELWVNQINGTARVIHEAALTATAFTATTDLPEGDYRAWIRVTPSGGVPLSWSAAFDFGIGAGTTPGAAEVTAVTADTARPTISWAVAANAVRYELWVNQVGGTTRIIHKTDLTGVEFTAVEDLASGSYRIWLRAFNAAGVVSAWSAPFNFTIT